MEAILGLVFVVAFPILGIMVLIWFRRIRKLFMYLRKNHPSEYAAIGEPSLITNNTPKNNMLFLRFIVGRRPYEIGDSELIAECQFLKKFFYSYVVLFVALVTSIMVASNAS